MGEIGDRRQHRVERWDARATYEIGVLVLRWLNENPPPGASEVAEEARSWGSRMKECGEARLRETGERTLRVL
jgi:hypothetical protein